LKKKKKVPQIRGSDRKLRKEKGVSILLLKRRKEGGKKNVDKPHSRRKKTSSGISLRCKPRKEKKQDQDFSLPKEKREERYSPVSSKKKELYAYHHVLSPVQKKEESKKRGSRGAATVGKKGRGRKLLSGRPHRKKRATTSRAGVNTWSHEETVCVSGGGEGGGSVTFCSKKVALSMLMTREEKKKSSEPYHSNGPKKKKERGREKNSLLQLKTWGKTAALSRNGVSGGGKRRV